MKLEDLNVQFAKPAPHAVYAVFLTRTTTEVVEVRVSNAELDYTHDPTSADEPDRAIRERAMEKNLRGETQRVVGPVHEVTVDTWQIVGPAADETRAYLVKRETPAT